MVHKGLTRGCFASAENREKKEGKSADARANKAKRSGGKETNQIADEPKERENGVSGKGKVLKKRLVTMWGMYVLDED